MLPSSPLSRTACRRCRGHGDPQRGAQHCSMLLRLQLLCVGTALQAVAADLLQPRLLGTVTSGVFTVLTIRQPVPGYAGSA